MEECINNRLRIIFYDYEIKNKEDSFKSAIFQLNYRNDYFKNIKKFYFAYGINVDNINFIYSIILIYKKERYYIDAIKENNFLKIKEACFNTVKIYDKDNWYNWDNFILFITFEDTLTSTVQRGGDLITNNKDEALFFRV